MFKKATFALLLTAGLLTTAFAAEENEPPRMYSSERPIETDMVGLPLPRAVPGSMTLRPCDVCTPVTLGLTTSAQFFVDSKPVSFADLQALAQKSSANVVVFYDTKTNAVTRIVVSDAR
ncbi:MAG TPA: hypothetical protein VGQ22_19560 [Steroidobacteraceae bacterium]|jgi:hypothetical protein|nr:hypothetical protein [Steroidobacteraceae bacterium]